MWSGHSIPGGPFLTKNTMANRVKELSNNLMSREFEDVETNLLFNLMRMQEILLSDICRRFKAKGGRFSQKKKQNYNRFIEKVKEALKWFDEAIEDDYIIGVDGNAFQYDKMRFEANELITLLLLYIDRVSVKPENFYNIFKHIRSLESCGVITEEDLEWFHKIKLGPGE